MGIFKSYDIRGRTPEDMNEALVERIGAATARHLAAKTIVVGRDMRDTSPGFCAAFTRGANAEGCAVIDLGLVTTPVTYWGVSRFGADGSAMITASHNPAGYNGLKICAAGPVALSYEGGLNAIEALVLDESFTPGTGAAENREMDPWPEYREHLQGFARDWRRLNVVVDAGNGMGGYGFDRVFADDWQGSLDRLYFEPDGTFPNHEANPLKAECLDDLRAKVTETGSDFGAAFDGDGDRCAFVDETGAIIPCDLVTALFAEDFLDREPGAGILYDLRSSHIVPETITRLGGKPYRERVGHSHMKKTLRDSGAVFGGELSGHYYFRDHFNSDSGLAAFAMMVNVLSRTGRPLSELVAPLRVYAQSGEINFEIADKDGAIDRLKERYADGRQDELDGLTVEFDDWWFNVRKSNTEPMLRLNLEASDAATCEARVAEIRSELEARGAVAGH